MHNPTCQYVDPEVSRTKFNREIEEYLLHEESYRSRGWFLVKSDWPTAIVILASNKTGPPTIVLSVQFDYSNYDAEPPSVRMIDPFSGRPLLGRELTTWLPRAVPGPEVPVPGGGMMERNTQPQPLMQAHSPEELPFLCIPGVKEYHDHPGHSGDLWEIHRSSGEGRLVQLLEVISTYGLEPVTGLTVQMVPQISFTTPKIPQ